MPSHNQVILAGHLTKNPELRHTQNQKAVASFSVATNSKRGDQEEVEFHRVTLWGKNAEYFCANYVKGDAVHILDGKLKTRKWENKDGVTQYTTEIHCFYASGKKKGERQVVANEQQYTPGIDDIPF